MGIGAVEPGSGVTSARWTRSDAWRVVVVAVAYFALAKLALLLAIPPGYATGVWPSAGVALALAIRWGHRVGWGVVLGSLATNVSTPWDGGFQALATPLATAALIGCGAALQALVGAMLVHRLVGEPRRLEIGKDVIRFFVFGGPVACLISPTVGIAVLWSFGVVDAASVPLNWATWWVGDSIGVCLFAPIVLICLDRSADRRQRVAAVVPVLLGLAGLVVVLFVYSSRSEQKRIARGFEIAASELDERIQLTVHDYLQVPASVTDFYAASNYVDHEEFATFVRRSLERYPGLLGVAWVPRVEAESRTGFEQALRRRLPESRGVLELKGTGLVPAAERPVYFPVRYVEPLAPHASAVGFDLLSDPTRGVAIRRAMASRGPAATAPLKLVTSGIGFVLVEPVYGYAGEPGRVGSPPADAPSGLAVAAFQSKDLIDEAVTGYRAAGFSLELTDITHPAREQTIHRSAEPPADASIGPWTSTFDVAGRTWRCSFAPTAAYLGAQRRWGAWGVLAGGMAVSCLLSAMLLISSGQASAVRRLVGQRTADLARLNGQLEDMAKTAHRFVDNVAHDFRTPLTVIKSFTKLLAKGGDRPDPAFQAESVGYIQRAADEMAQMIDDFLDSSKLKHNVLPIHRDRHTVAELFDHVRPTVRTRAAHRDIDVAETIEPGLPEVFCDLPKAGRVLVNLAMNAIKFSPDGAGVSLWARGEGDHVVVGVTDRGPGIAEADLRQLCDRFSQVGDSQPTIEKGFGLGLSIAKELAWLNLGKMRIESEPGEGSTFSFTLPRHDGAAIVRAYLDMREVVREDAVLWGLRVSCAQPGTNAAALRQFLAATTYAQDLVMPLGDDPGVCVLGNGDRPEKWIERLQAAWARSHPDLMLRIEESGHAPPVTDHRSWIGGVPGFAERAA